MHGNTWMLSFATIMSSLSGDIEEWKYFLNGTIKGHTH